MSKNLSKEKCVRVEWILSDLTESSEKGVKITGRPETVKYKDKKAMAFNGSCDGITLSQMPLSGLEKFTIEMIFNPYSGGNFEQRFLHCGEVNGDRVLLELRATPTHWYFDAFIKTGEDQIALIDPVKLHPLDQWYHIAYVNDGGKFASYVNGEKELEGVLNVATLKSGQTSVGMRQNEVSWFKGAVYKVRISSDALKPEDFIEL
jgi:hypothetical protein